MKIRRIIRKKFTASKNGIDVKTIFLLLYFSSLTSFDIAVGKDICDKDINNENVGNISIYKLIPSIPIVLVVTILINIPRILVRNPPIIKIIVDLINFSLNVITNKVYVYILNFRIVVNYYITRRNSDFLFIIIILLKIIKNC